MKSVTLLSVLLVAAVASASVQIVVDPPVQGVGRDGQATMSVNVRGIATGNDAFTSIEIGFFGPVRQQWTMLWSDVTESWYLPASPSTPVGSTQTVIRDTVFTPAIVSYVSTTVPPEIFTIGTPAEDMLTAPLPSIGGHEIVVAGSGTHYWYGQGTYLGDSTGGGITYALAGDVTNFTIGQIVMDKTAYDTIGVHVLGGIAYKTLANGGNPETNGSTGIDQWIGLVPEPASISLLAIGAVAAFIRRRRA